MYFVFCTFILFTHYSLKDLLNAHVKYICMYMYVCIYSLNFGTHDTHALK